MQLLTEATPALMQTEVRIGGSVCIDLELDANAELAAAVDQVEQVAVDQVEQVAVDADPDGAEVDPRL